MFTFSEEILNDKLHFLCIATASVMRIENKDLFIHKNNNNRPLKEKPKNAWQSDRIDFILVYEITGDNKQRNNDIKARRRYLKNLEDKGIQFDIEIDDGVHYVKVHAPFDALCEIAEDMKIKMPTAENDIEMRAWYDKNRICRFFRDHDPFQIKNPQVKQETSYFVAHFKKDRINEFINHDKPDEFFSPIERSRLVYYILDQTKFGDENVDVGIYNLQVKGILLDAYPLHDGPTLENSNDRPVNDRQRLQSDWASFRRIFKYQPIPAIKSYFGEKVALYFAWLGFYTTFLVPASIIGILCFIYGIASAFDNDAINEICNEVPSKTKDNKFYMCPLCDKICSYYLLQTQGCLYAKITHFFDNEATLFFSSVMAIWATIFLEFWKRKQVSLAYDWHAMDFEEEEERPRPEYLARVTQLKPNPVTLKSEPYMPPREKYYRFMGAFGVVFFFIVLVLGAVVGVIVFRAAFYIFLIRQDLETLRSKSKLVVSACAACINLIAINLLKFVYQRIALWLTQWENPRTNTDYEDSFTVKMFWFQFVNTYASIFYVAFFKTEVFTGSPGQYKRFTAAKFRFEGCSVQGCFLELTIQLIIIMVGQQIIGNIIEIVIPFFKKKYNDWKNKKEGISDNKNEPQWITDFELEMQTKFSLFWQYLEIVLQYGFVTMFVAAFPLAPFFALLNNMVEIRLDAVNFIHNFRRPAAERAEDIGAWYGILATLTTFSTVVNAFVLAFTSELIPRLVYRYKFKDDSAYSGFIDFSLSKFPVAELDENSRPENASLNGWPQQDICRYPGYHDSQSPYKRNIQYWIILSARLSFLLAFIVVVLTIKWVVAFIIPDMPKDLDLKVKREHYLEAEAERKHKERTRKRKKSETNPPDQPINHISMI